MITVLALIIVSRCASGCSQTRYVPHVCVIVGTNPQYLRLQNRVAAGPERIPCATHTRPSKIYTCDFMQSNCRYYRPLTCVTTHLTPEIYVIIKISSYITENTLRCH